MSEGIVASVEAEFQKIETAVENVFHHTEEAVVTDVHTAEADVKTAEVKVETVAKEAFDAVAAEVKQLRADLDSLVARIEKHNTSGTPFPVK
jgi:hypothetical protein